MYTHEGCTYYHTFLNINGCVQEYTEGPALCITYTDDVINGSCMLVMQLSIYIPMATEYTVYMNNF